VKEFVYTLFSLYFLFFSIDFLHAMNNTKKETKNEEAEDENAEKDMNDDDDIKLIVWDFDLTLLRIHSFSKRIIAQEVKRRDYEHDFADATFLRSFLDEMKRKGIKVSIASFGKREVIEEYMKLLISEEYGDYCSDFAFVDKRKSIVTPNDVGGSDGCSMKDKGKMLDVLMKRFVLNKADDDDDDDDDENENKNENEYETKLKSARKRVVFFDDDEDNINAAKKLGYTFSVHAPEAFTRETWREMYWKIPKMRELFPEVDVNLTLQRTRKIIDL
jgi:FMN phosphatase YigB (HAD superfamily)